MIQPDANADSPNEVSASALAPDDVEKLIREYRPSMDLEVLHSWATEAASTLSRLRGERDALISAVGEHVTVRSDYLARGLKAEDLAAERIRSYIGNLTGEADDPFYQAVLALWGAGFDYAHGLRACGHSIGDWRDPSYDPEKPDQPLECRCVGCEREAKLVEGLREMRRVFGDPLTRRALGGHNEAQQAAMINASTLVSGGEAAGEDGP